MDLRLDGQVFAVTGAAQGIGAAIARELAAAGAQVAAVDIDAGGMAPLATEGMSVHAADLGTRAGAGA
ncbi:MAG: SDR family NAD(P)-dependent oxidoreductase, partial [Rhodobacterales bacterium]|nr:SDR family NAD(P)-dependent oxidoreductase [Rhodobacterales bacterium]MDX5498593.1 SDR family NAD(P)-dependent oxidoreductase [Rhodobacterales bacterium]